MIHQPAATFDICIEKCSLIEACLSVFWNAMWQMCWMKGEILGPTLITDPDEFGVGGRKCTLTEECSVEGIFIKIGVSNLYY